MSVTSATLLERLRDPRDADAWGRLVDLYAPLIRVWAERLNVHGADADDLVQEVMAVVVRRFPEFVHPEKPGAFRGWLRAIAANCARSMWKARRVRPTVPGGSDFGSYLNRLEDPTDDFARAWEREHDLFVTRKLLDRIRPDFETRTWELFGRFVLDGVPAEEVAAEAGVTANAVYIAKSRVLARLRQEAGGLLG
ncbi:RNA polymerase sigma factor [Gemmata obscuriglobus]|uniref:Sigma-70 family RNA polymerase sigma factor n=1 Tax=Gemmata obscuriglobus TaxID=114 RepID=A0A2Z3H8C0_9BACT|nr:sigma-70 family RNA polymerase sigma factor [Gemmata obscuriglobus]AWM41131.1 sigma-70 family RNA polymerase sigma factor [Gemmata obscuriglobus]QEG25534.1 RNA polymerase sigma factor [Gemmata obscuriglobus]VTR98872.1 extracytoplasmic function alternative sigma factor : RNA polymerase, sigma-24 subunit, ECF subfamily OS=Pirellula staleyi (strain ATCC 27377 / DSM 6068 / ICPB 4128) GN=Psta_4560 PE=4 SV=1: Sigma70_r2 [Gemmata obscuriglobus UQM 2246]